MIGWPIAAVIITAIIILSIIVLVWMEKKYEYKIKEIENQ